ncbi:Emc5 protein [Maudiozyma humilis]|uniref:Emc5 protein n=1 Tax=Maudiozyma humilis TaxID=51915 RepID=A0AAV5RWQ0_MAUHU|nr:Emc5 protein [Kazachstania humilis]
MALFPKILQALSLVVISHSAFSSYEFHQVVKQLSQELIDDSVTLPKDITYEAVCGLLIFVLASFLEFEKITFFPLRRNHGEPIETLSQGQYLKHITLNKATNVDNLLDSDPTGDVSYTPNMVNIHEKRKIMDDWLKKQQK